VLAIVNRYGAGLQGRLTVELAAFRYQLPNPVHGAVIGGERASRKQHRRESAPQEISTRLSRHGTPLSG
jgi:hypothetical protein